MLAQAATEASRKAILEAKREELRQKRLIRETGTGNPQASTKQPPQSAISQSTRTDMIVQQAETISHVSRSQVNSDRGREATSSGATSEVTREPGDRKRKGITNSPVSEAKNVEKTEEMSAQAADDLKKQEALNRLKEDKTANQLKKEKERALQLEQEAKEQQNRKDRVKTQTLRLNEAKALLDRMTTFCCGRVNCF